MHGTHEKNDNDGKRDSKSWDIVKRIILGKRRLRTL